jgi:hypothetical protein
MNQTAPETPDGNHTPQTSNQRFEIRIRGHLSPQWSDWFEGFTITHTTDGDSILAGSVTDQSALHSLLARIRDLNLALVSVNQVDTNREDHKEG